MTRQEFDRHMKQRHDSSVTYHCIDCSQDFPSYCALKKHPRGDAAHTKDSSQSGILCKPCERIFHSAKAYDNHLKLKEHKGIRCFAYPTCGRCFRTKAGMIAHLESGACKSKLNRQKLDDLIRQHDTANVVLKVEYSNPANLLSSGLLTPMETPSSLPPFHGASFPFPAASVEDRSDSDDEEATEIHYRRRSSSHTADDCTIQGPPFVGTSLPRFSPTISEIPDSDSDEEGTIILTPTSSISRRESFSFAPSSPVIPLTSGVSTPRSTYSTTLFLQRVFGRTCYLCNREFKNETAAQQHATSTAHAPRIYHCPTFLFPAGHAAKFPPRDFKSLSGLIAHLESGSCEGGKETLESAVKYVEERLRGVRMGGILMEK
jgi:DNA-directed RNA polymerase subunit RPC12/RpoP